MKGYLVRAGVSILCCSTRSSISLSCMSPVLFLPLFSFNNSIYIAFPLKGFTVKWYESMAAQGR